MYGTFPSKKQVIHIWKKLSAAKFKVAISDNILVENWAKRKLNGLATYLKCRWNQPKHREGHTGKRMSTST